MHAPFARGVSHLMYVGDVPQPQPESQVTREKIVIGVAALAVAGGVVGINKRNRKRLAVVSILAFLANRLGA